MYKNFSYLFLIFFLQVANIRIYIYHLNFQGANILVDNKGCIKLADFGASKQVVELVYTFPVILLDLCVFIMHSASTMNVLYNWGLHYCRQPFLALSLWRVHHTGWLLKLFVRLVIACKHNSYPCTIFFVFFQAFYSFKMVFLYYFGIAVWVYE